MNEKLIQAMSDLEEQTLLTLVQERLDSGEDPLEIIAACREGMADIGRRYEAKEYYVSELIMAGEMFKQVNAILASYLTPGSGDYKGKVVIGTVKNDIHDIGKDLVVSLLHAAGYEVFDLGTDVPAEKFVNTVQETGANIVGLSGLLTIAFDSMKATVDALQDAGLRPGVKVMIGGGPVTEQVRVFSGADAMGVDAQTAVTLCNQWTEEMEVA